MSLTRTGRTRPEFLNRSTSCSTGPDTARKSFGNNIGTSDRNGSRSYLPAPVPNPSATVKSNSLSSLSGPAKLVPAGNSLVVFRQAARHAGVVPVMGHSHAATGLLVGLVTAPVAPVSGPVQVAAWVAVWGGAALLPDLDTGGSSAARMWGPGSRWAAKGIGKLAGGHRAGTHDILVAPILAGLLVWIAAAHPVTAMVMIAVMIGCALIALDPVLPGDQGHPLGNVMVSWVAAYGVVFAGGLAAYWWLPFVAAGGVVVHILGDAVTTAGVPVPLSTWMSSSRRSWGPQLFNTGTMPERVIVSAVWVGVVVAAWFAVPSFMPGGVHVPSDVQLAEAAEWVRNAPYVVRDAFYGRFFT